MPEYKAVSLYYEPASAYSKTNAKQVYFTSTTQSGTKLILESTGNDKKDFESLQHKVIQDELKNKEGKVVPYKINSGSNIQGTGQSKSQSKDELVKELRDIAQTLEKDQSNKDLLLNRIVEIGHKLGFEDGGAALAVEGELTFISGIYGNTSTIVDSNKNSLSTSTIAIHVKSNVEAVAGVKVLYYPWLKDVQEATGGTFFYGVEGGIFEILSGGVEGGNANKNITAFNFNGSAGPTILPVDAYVGYGYTFENKFRNINLTPQQLKKLQNLGGNIH
ncbi:MAG: hypothetical protein A2Y23_06380 [Clostridiales bacterium GWB2_37_7]|nr:MAG: hypothetical protein A2Y23_06380 [Clostridiales bacterium GWB2_37_7]